MKLAFNDNIKRYELDAIEGEDPELLDQFYDEMIANINGIYINSNYVTLSYGSAESALIQKYFPYSEARWQFESLCGSMQYSVLGCENLTIFD